MVCKSCGQNISDNAKFCNHCGAKAEQAKPQTAPSKKFCTVCGAQLDGSEQFCTACGAKTGWVKPLPAAGSGRLLATLKMVSMYNGEPTIGFAKATGVLSVYDDRLEYKKQLGNSLGGALGLAGFAVAKHQANKDPVIILPLTRILTIRVGKYMGVYNTLTVDLRDGSTVTFCPAIPASAEPQNIIATLTPYL